MKTFEEKFKRIIKKVSEIGFDEFYQAGAPSQIHELNLICVSEKLNHRYWVSKSFGKFELICKDELTNKIFKRVYCKNQTELLNMLDDISKEIEAISMIAI